MLDKAGLLPPIDWTVRELAILVRERTYKDGIVGNRMRVWGTIPLPSSRTVLSKEEFSDEEEGGVDIAHDSEKITTIQQGLTYHYSAKTTWWTSYVSSISPETQEDMPASLRISSYNVLVDSMHPPARERYPLLVETLLSASAQADIVVMQEVTDDFLSHLLGNDQIRESYPYTTQGPPQQADIGPMPSLRNIVVLSRWSFRWEYVPFQRRHKGAVVVKFDNIGLTKDSKFHPLVVAGVHLTCGLTDGSVAAKKSQVQTTLSYLSRNYQESPCIIAGDFNIPTSTHTIREACKNHKITANTEGILLSLEHTFSEASFSDSWTTARIEVGDTTDRTTNKSFFDVFEGEEGATFDPIENHLAAETSGSPHNRPQRYDRILLKGQDTWSVSSFNMFGQPGEEDESGHYASDHWGIRSTLKAHSISDKSRSALDLVTMGPVSVRRTSPAIFDNEVLHHCLKSLGMIPTKDQVSQRERAFGVLEQLLNTRSDIPLVLVTVGSYGLGVWTSSSDIDCMCLGPISSKTFFALARQRLRRASDLGVRVLRRVDAKTGTMLELEIGGVRMDLQYCPATKIVERYVTPPDRSVSSSLRSGASGLTSYSWPESIRRAPSDPIFGMPMQSLRKLKAYRDLDYLQRTVPDLAAFRTAYRCIKLWAQQRGIYSAKFGYLGGIHITLMLSRVCKLVSVLHGTAGITAADILSVFFHHYAEFDWKSDMIFDPFFEKQGPKYHRLGREPMVVLGFYTPNFNTAHTASVPSVDTLTEEFKRADSMLFEDNMTWTKFFGGSTNGDTDTLKSHPGAQDFLQAYNSYVKIDVNYWGPSLKQGSGLVGWLESKCVMLLVGKSNSNPHIFNAF
jgi:endonuclease/exonuclease/phosphatase family metal-dependent hydrolase